MPLFYQHNINEHERLAVWHITEEERFFSTQTPVQAAAAHPRKRLQHLAARYLLDLLQPGFPYHLIEIAMSKKPLVSNEAWHFSVSHCGDYAAAIVSDRSSVGIDVELVTPRIDRVKKKFLKPEEIDLLPGRSPELLTLCWSAKEAIYKWYGKGQVDFKGHISIESFREERAAGTMSVRFSKDPPAVLTVGFRVFGALCLAWV